MSISTARSQKLSLDIDFENFAVKGSTLIEVEQDPAARCIYLCAQQLEVTEVSVGDLPARCHVLKF
jgi:hypothetical protein